MCKKMGSLEGIILSQLTQMQKDKTNVLYSYADSSLYMCMYIGGNKCGQSLQYYNGLQERVKRF